MTPEEREAWIARIQDADARAVRQGGLPTSVAANDRSSTSYWVGRLADAEAENQRLRRLLAEAAEELQTALSRGGQELRDEILSALGAPTVDEGDRGRTTAVARDPAPNFNLEDAPKEAPR